MAYQHSTGHTAPTHYQYLWLSEHVPMEMKQMLKPGLITTINHVVMDIIHFQQQQQQHLQQQQQQKQDISCRQ